MASPHGSAPKDIPNPSQLQTTPPSGSPSRAASIARLGSPVPSHPFGTPPVRQIPTPSQVAKGTDNETSPHITSPLAGSVKSKVTSHAGGESALAAALKGSITGSPPRSGTPPTRAMSPPHMQYSPAIRSNYGSQIQQG